MGWVMNGKGDTRRPMQVSREQWERNWRRIFSKAKQPRKQPPEATERRSGKPQRRDNQHVGE